MTELARPDIPRQKELALPKTQSALIVVDMQNDFAHPDGKLFCQDAPATVTVIADLITRARSAGVPVIYTQDWHGDNDPEFELWPVHAVAGSWGAEILEALQPEPGELVIKKLRYDGFYGTSLDHVLRGLGVKKLVITGTVANICVLHTAGSAALRWYGVTLPEDAVSALTPFDKESALRQVTFLYRGNVAKASAISFA